MAEQQRPAEQGRSGEGHSAMARRTSARGMARRESFSDPWDQPFGFLRRFTEDLDRLFGAPYGSRLSGLSPFSGGWEPSLDVFQRENHIIVRADLPGLSKDDINVEISDDAIVIQGERREEREEDRENVYMRERRYGRFSRTIPMPDDVDAQQARATFTNGILEVMLPLSEPAHAKRSRRIEITEGGPPRTEASGKPGEKARTAGGGGSL